jgi:murein DD-endopeptidase MepM/ murein hydrolase activator NlpD
MTRASLVAGSLAALALATLAGGAALGQTQPAPGYHDRFRWPLRGPIVQQFKSGDTDGIDIAAPVGEPVHAAADGTCIYAGDDIKTYGQLVLIRHADGYVTAYAGNSELDVREGDAVPRGQIIARSGDSGAAKSPRLHFELRKDGKAIDPVRYLVPL